MLELKQNIINEFKSDKYDVFLIGKTFVKDIDFVFIGKEQKSLINNYEDFSRKLRHVISDKYYLITKRTQLKDIPKNKPIFHLLFYPSYDFFINWELPSFWASTLENSELLMGSYDELNSLKERYYNRKKQIINSVFEFQINYYHDIAKDLYFDLTFNYSNNNLEHYKGTIFYLLKFSLIEIITELFDVRNLWNTKNLINFLRTNFTNLDSLVNRLEFPESIDCSLNSLTKYLFEIIELLNNPEKIKQSNQA